MLFVVELTPSVEALEAVSARVFEIVSVAVSEQINNGTEVKMVRG